MGGFKELSPMTVRKYPSKRQAEITCRRQMKGFLKRVVRRRYIVIRSLSLILILGTFFYLVFLAHWKDRFFEVHNDYTLEFENTEAKEGDPISELYGIIFRMKSGELEFYHSRNRTEEIVP